MIIDLVNLGPKQPLVPVEKKLATSFIPVSAIWPAPVLRANAALHLMAAAL